jgi:hypothetical protein
MIRDRTFEEAFVAAGGCKVLFCSFKEQLSTVSLSLPMSTLIPDLRKSVTPNCRRTENPFYCIKAGVYLDLLAV